MSSNNATLLILGCGPGVGLSSAKALAATGLFKNVVLCSRNKERIQQHGAEVRQFVNDKVDVHTVSLDLNDTEGLSEQIGKIRQIGELRCLLFNAARIRPSKPLEASVEELQEDFTVSRSFLVETKQRVC